MVDIHIESVQRALDNLSADVDVGHFLDTLRETYDRYVMIQQRNSYNEAAGDETREDAGKTDRTVLIQIPMRMTLVFIKTHQYNSFLIPTDQYHIFKSLPSNHTSYWYNTASPMKQTFRIQSWKRRDRRRSGSSTIAA